MNLSFRAHVFLGVALLALATAASLFLRLEGADPRLLILELRLPRLLLALGVGGALALSGLVLQTVLSNPLAEPFTLGIASASALGAALASGLGFSRVTMNFGAAAGAGVVILILLGATRSRGNHQEPLILFGVMMSLIGSSLLALWMALADPLGVQNINFWMLGDLSRSSMAAALVLLLGMVISGVYLAIQSKNLDAFLFGEESVESFGVSRVRVRTTMILIVSILVGASVSLSGMIGFVGLVVPHLIRAITGHQRHSRLIPLTAMAGAALLAGSDVLSRMIAEPRELPVGAVTALLGAPVFLLLYIRGARGRIS